LEERGKAKGNPPQAGKKKKGKTGRPELQVGRNTRGRGRDNNVVTIEMLRKLRMTVLTAGNGPVTCERGGQSRFDRGEL
jgi:hypothetical protein